MSRGEAAKGCDSCTTSTVPRWTHEADMARMERANKRNFVLLILTVSLLVITNALWIWHESQYVDEVTTVVTQDADNGTNYFTGGDFNGEADGNY